MRGPRPSDGPDPVSAAEASRSDAGQEPEGEEVDGLAVLDPAQLTAREPAHELERVHPRTLPAAAVAASSFLAGAALAGLMQRRRRRRLPALASPRRLRRTSGPVGELVQIVGSRSLLVDVHLLSGRD